MTALSKVEAFQPTQQHFSDSQIELIKNSICKGATDEELQFFIFACQRTGLDPFARQIYSVPRGGQRTIQTSVDGFRAIGDRTGRYCPGREPTFEYDKNGNLFSATAYVKKLTTDGTWHEVSANAHFSEYNANTPLWKKMPRAMLSKCAECLAIRKCFPSKMSGVYGEEEMDQADHPAVHVKPLYIEDTTKLSDSQCEELIQLYDGCSKSAQTGIYELIKIEYKAASLKELPTAAFERIKGLLLVRYKHNQAQLLEQEMADVKTVEVTE